MKKKFSTPRNSSSVPWTNAPHAPMFIRLTLSGSSSSFGASSAHFWPVAHSPEAKCSRALSWALFFFWLCKRYTLQYMIVILSSFKRLYICKQCIIFKICCECYNFRHMNIGFVGYFILHDCIFNHFSNVSVASNTKQHEFTEQ